MQPEKYKLAESPNGYVIYKGDEEYITPLHTNIVIKDRGLAEATLRKLNYNRPMAVRRYLGRYDYAGLINLIEEHLAVEKVLDKHYYDIRMRYDCIISILNERRFFNETQLRRVIDAYTEHGTMGVVLAFGLDDPYDNYDPFLSYYGVSAGSDAINDVQELLEEALEDQYNKEMPLDTAYLKGIFDKYSRFLLPKTERAAKDFKRLIYGDDYCED